MRLQVNQGLGYPGMTGRGLVIQADPGVKRGPISNIPNTKRTGDVAQVIEHLPSKTRP
jgi:hypothetical protein